MELVKKAKIDVCAYCCRVCVCVCLHGSRMRVAAQRGVESQAHELKPTREPLENTAPKTPLARRAL